MAIRTFWARTKHPFPLPVDRGILSPEAALGALNGDPAADPRDKERSCSPHASRGQGVQGSETEGHPSDPPRVHSLQILDGVMPPGTSHPSARGDSRALEQRCTPLTDRLHGSVTLRSGLGPDDKGPPRVGGPLGLQVLRASNLARAVAR